MPPRNKKKRFATLWVNSPFAGNIVKCMEMVKWEVVDWQDLELRRYVDLEGGKCPVDLLVPDEGLKVGLPSGMPPPIAHDKQTYRAHIGRVMSDEILKTIPEVGELEETLKAEEALKTFTFPPPGAPHEEWVELWKRLGPVYMRIAQGTEEADQAQRMVLQKIFDKVYQKEERVEDDTVQPVVFLPVRGDLSSTYIAPFTQLRCPHCMEMIEFEREGDDEEV